MLNNKPLGAQQSQEKMKTSSAAAKVEEDDLNGDGEDDWGMEDDDWGDLEDNDDHRDRNAKNSVKKPSDLLGMHDVAGLGDSHNDSSADKKKQKNNLFLGGIVKDEVGNFDDEDDDDDEDIDNFLDNGNEDKFNQVLSKTKEGGGLLASIGLNKDDVKDGQSLDDSELNDSQH